MINKIDRFLRIFKLNNAKNNKHKFIDLNSVIHIPIFFYCNSFEDEYSKEIINQFSPKELSSADEVIDAFKSYEYFNFININDVTEKNTGLEIFFKRENLKKHSNFLSGVFTEEEYNINLTRKNYKLFFYILSKDIYEKQIVNNINILNINGKFYFFNNLQLSSFINKTLDIKYYLYEKKHNKEKGIKGYDNLDRFVNFLLKNSMILFLSKKENYNIEYDENGEILKKGTFYKKTEDLKEINLIEDIDAIIRFNIVCNNLNIYHDSSVWSEHILYKTTDGVSVVDKNFTILYANEKRRQRHKNNILGKKCYQIFRSKETVCENCTLNLLFNNSNLLPNATEKRELEVTDKAGNTYYLIEYNTIAQIKVYNEKIGITACKDINFRHKITELSKNIQNFNDKRKIFKQIIDTFVELGFNGVRIYENYKLNTSDDKNYSPAMVLTGKSNYDFINYGELITTENLKEEIFLFEEISNPISMIKYFDSSMENNIIKIFDINKTIDSDFKKILISKMGIKDKWIDLPLWCGNKLMGVIALDFNSEKYKWSLVNEDIKFQLLHASVFLASAINNSNLNLRNNKFKKLTEEISHIDRNEFIYDQICKVMLSQESDESNIFSIFYKYEHGKYRLSNSYYNNQTNIITDNNIYESGVDVILNNNKGKLIFSIDHLIKYRDYNNLIKNNSLIKDVNSIIDIYYKSHEKTFGVLRLIKTGKNTFPFSLEDYNLFKMPCNRIADILFGVELVQLEIENKIKYRVSLVHALKTPITTISNIISFHSKFLYNIKNIEDFYEIQESKEEKIEIKKYNFYKTLINLKTATEITKLYVNSIDSLDLRKYTIKNEINLRNILNDLCFLISFNVKNSKKRGLKIDFKQISDDFFYLKTIKGDENKLKIAFFNILDNAFKYSMRIPLFSKTSNYYPITVKSAQDLKDVNLYKIIFTNYGSIVEEEELEKVFKEEYRGKNSDTWNVDGKGFGLYACKEIFNAHKFTIEMKSYKEEFKTEIIVGVNLTENNKLIIT